MMQIQVNQEERPADAVRGTPPGQGLGREGQ